MLKYVVVNSRGYKIPIIFPSLLEHSYFKLNNPTSAGFCFLNYDNKTEKIEATVYGESISLDLKSDPNDAMLINSSLRDY
jgi:hypothetical protein